MKDARILDDLTRLNNELVNSQRQLARSSAELRRANALVVEQNRQLESKVAQRTAVLADQLALFRTLTENAPEVIWGVDGKTGELSFANRAWYALVGGVEGDWSSQASRVALMHPDDRARAQLNWQHALETLSPFSGIRRLLSKDGSYRVMSYRAAPVLDAQGGASSWVGIDTDITQIKNTEAALQHALGEQTRARQEAETANRAKSTFLAAMSHEIRTPMTGVLGMLELVSAGALAPDQRATIAVAQESGRSLLRLVDDVLDFSRIEADLVKLEIAPASIAALVDRICGVNAAAASMKGLLLQARVSDDVGQLLEFDSLRVGRMLNVLIANAIRFTQHGKVTLQVGLEWRSEEIEHLHFVVEDTGIGMAPDVQLRVFQPAVLAGSEPSTGSGGCLVICRRLVELMGGTLDVQSAPGVGTSITARLAFRAAVAPERAAAAAGAPTAGTMPAPVSAVATAPAAAAGPLLLVVDDHPTNRMVLQRLARLLGYASESAENGRLGLDAWKSGRFGAVLADCNMPEMDGYEMTRAIRTLEREGGARRTPVIACTAAALGAEEARCVEAGMDDYLVKPVTLAALGQRLSRWMPPPPGPREG